MSITNSFKTLSNNGVGINLKTQIDKTHTFQFNKGQIQDGIYTDNDILRRAEVSFEENIWIYLVAFKVLFYFN